MKIYADILFLINFFMDLFIIYASAVILRYKKSIRKAALISAASALIGSVFQLMFYGSAVNILLGFLLLGFMVKAYFKPAETKTFIHQSAVMFFSAFFTAGFFIWLSGYSNLMYFARNYFSLTALVFAVCFVSVSAVFWLWHRKIRQIFFEREKYADAEVYWENKKTNLRVFVDSGCMLEKSPCGRSVIIVSLYEIKRLFEPEFVMEMAGCETAEEIMILAEKYGISDEFEMISFSTASGKGEMACLKCTAEFVVEQSKAIYDVSAGIFMGNLFSDNECGGLIGAAELKNIMGGD